MLAALLSSTLLSCGSGAEPAAHGFARALTLAEDHPEDAAAACASLRTLSGECLTAVAAAQARRKGVAAVSWCASIEQDLWRHECAFEVVEEAVEAPVAERAALCTATGTFAPRCRLHLWNETAQDLLATHPEPIATERFAVTLAWAPAEEEVAWTAFWEAALHPREQRTPAVYDLARCEALPGALRRDCQGAIATAFRRRVNLLAPPPPEHPGCDDERTPEQRLAALGAPYVAAPALDRWAERALDRLCR